jgi:hypothetical protein
MIHLPENKLNLLLPWKCASQTLQLRLQAHSKPKYPKLFYYNTFLHRVCQQHLELGGFLALPESKMGYALAVFVRNPYDRVYSGFQQLIRDIKVIPKLQFKNQWVKELVLSDIAENHKTLEEAQYDVNKWFNLVRPYQILESGRNTCFNLYPASYWTHSNGQLIPDFIGYVESFEKYFLKLRNTFGIQCISLDNANVSNPNLKSVDHARYQYIDRFDDKTISKINALFHDDFMNFGYKKIIR